MENVINKEKLEQLLTQKWTEFLDYRKIIAFVMISVRDNNFPVFEENNLPQKNTEIKISRFVLKNDGFLLWIDFTVPKEPGFVVGTCEAILKSSGKLILNQILGQFIRSH
jgi:hypothetical protein